MRLLFTFAGGHGHLQPLLPLARAAATAGHTVAFGAQPGMRSAVETAGFPCHPTGGDTLHHERRPLLDLDPDREDRAIRDGYAGRVAAERARRILTLARQWRPDLLVCDEVDFGAMVAAERLGLPYASVVVIAAGSFLRRELLAAPLARLREAHGLPGDPELRMLYRHLVLCPVPPGFRDPEFPLPGTGHPIRPSGPAPAGPPPAWATAIPGAPVVYVTLGTIFNVESGDLLSRVLAGVRELPVNVLVTVGPGIDPAEFGPQPHNVHIERYVPQRDVLPYCDLVVCHGGSGTVVGALAHGVPLVLTPMGADQPHNAARCERLGVGRALDAVRGTPQQVREAVSGVLADPAYRRAAVRIRDEAAGLPGPEHAVALLERLVGTHPGPPSGATTRG